MGAVARPELYTTGFNLYTLTACVACGFGGGGGGGGGVGALAVFAVSCVRIYVQKARCGAPAGPI